MIHRHTKAIGHALDGIRWAIRTQPNYRVHLLSAIISCIAGIYLGITYVEWLVIAVLICLGLTVETLNTAIERLGDAITQEHNEHIKLAKDVSAGAMLFYSVGAALVASIIFIPRMLQLLGNV